jgi:hypothetical protein
MRFPLVVLFTAAALLHKPFASAATELQERSTLSTAAQQAFANEDFAALEAQSRDYRSTKSRTASGLWKLTLFYVGLNAAMYVDDSGSAREAAYAALETRNVKWEQRYPTSPTAYIAHSMALIDQAWSYRGSGYAKTVKPESWAPFFKYLALARENLEMHKTVASSDPRWYETMLSIARAESWERDRFDKLLNEALQREPLFYQTYFQALEYLLPKWGGNTHEIEAFAQQAVRRTFKSEGRGLYARIYWYASQTQFQTALFTDSLAAWSRMRASFEDVIDRYPDDWNLNHYAKFACLAQDRDKTRELLERTETAIVPEAWNTPALREQCKAWATMATAI